MNYRQAKIVLRTSIFIILLLFVVGVLRCTRPETEQSTAEPLPAAANVQTKTTSPAKSAEIKSEIKAALDHQRLKISKKVQSHSHQFNDLNEAHLAYAQKVGIAPIRNTRQIMRINKPIVKVTDCDEYSLDKLTHSYPILVEPAARLLHDIGAEFNRKLAAQGGGRYRIKVTSLLRTTESVHRLKRGNINSTENSAHLYGTTFDISYVDFPEGLLNTKKHSDGDLKNLLAEVLLEMKEQGRCLVKFERKQGCFHITSTGK
ncbi:MAG: hypothetical protein K2O38_02515 [Muribaculaceae bacterium]|nr:hypothetical protein [Muribaculaceae bacterium]MDE7110761.1 hypothetical protein [Muribaculaceae bacterium]